MEYREQIIEYVPVDILLFDEQNPRLPKGVDGSKDPEIISWMLADGTITEVMESIAEKGYFAGEPMLVVPSQEQGHLTVVEGNRRLTALKLLSDPSLATTRRSKIAQIAGSVKIPTENVPVLRYDNRDKVLDYLGFRHITGIKEWNPLAKARYLSQLQENVRQLDRQEQFKSLARTIGSNSNYVARLLTALKVYESLEDEDYFGIKRDRDDPVDFSVLSTALTYTNISKFIGVENVRDVDASNLDRKHLREFTEWTFEKTNGGRPRVRESRRLSDLNRVIEEDDALSSFRNGESLETALLRTGVPAESFRVAIDEARDRLGVAQGLLHRVQDLKEHDREQVQNVRLLARTLEGAVENLLRETED